MRAHHAHMRPLWGRAVAGPVIDSAFFHPFQLLHEQTREREKETPAEALKPTLLGELWARAWAELVALGAG